jgi:hypothetical protein
MVDSSINNDEQRAEARAQIEAMMAAERLIPSNAELNQKIQDLIKTLTQKGILP